MPRDDGIVIYNNTIFNTFDYNYISTGWILGTSHIRTLSGEDYTYSGMGEYWLLRTPTFLLQGRTAQAGDKRGTPVPGTVYAAFSVQDLSKTEFTETQKTRAEVTTISSPRVHINMDDERTGKCGQSKLHASDIHLNITSVILLAGVLYYWLTGMIYYTLPQNIEI